jgi:WD40 repeat protein
MTRRELEDFARAPHVRLLVEREQGDGREPEFRLAGAAIADALLSPYGEAERRQAERALAGMLLAAGRQAAWNHVHPYLLRSLPAHAARAGMIDELLTDDGYLLHADLPRLLAAAGHATSPSGQRRARMLRLCLDHAASADAPSRAAIFGVSAMLAGLGETVAAAGARVPYETVWAAVARTEEHAILDAHAGEARSVQPVTARGRTLLAAVTMGAGLGPARASIHVWDPATGGYVRALPCDPHGTQLCAVPHQDGELLAAVAENGWIVLLDPVTGERHARLVRYRDDVMQMCSLAVHGRTALVIAGRGGSVEVRDAGTGEQLCSFDGRHGTVQSVCPLPAAGDGGGHGLLASTGDDGTVRFWEPGTGILVRESAGHKGAARSLCALSVDGRPALATAGDDGTVRVWDAETGAPLRAIRVGARSRPSVCAVPLAERFLLATSGADGTAIRIWDPRSGDAAGSYDGHGSWPAGLCAFTLDGHPMLASAGRDGTVRTWDPAGLAAWPAGATGSHATGGAPGVQAMTVVSAGGRTRLVTGHDDHTIRLWDPATGTPLGTTPFGERRVRAVCSLISGGRPLVAAAGHDGGIIRTGGTISLWDAATMTTGAPPQQTLTGHDRGVNALAALGDLLASGGDDGTVRIWSLRAGRVIRELTHDNGVHGICPLILDGRTLLATAGTDGTVLIWDPDTGRELAALVGHEGSANSVCSFPLRGQTLLATTGYDGTVRTWDPQSGQAVRVLRGHAAAVFGICAVIEAGRPLLATASEDQTARIWDPASGACRAVIPTRDTALSVAHVSGLVVIGTRQGMLAVRPLSG